ncbi:hypothetical protein ['Camptotheca acuminata' phytoplasma]|uniref:hypothetical protein n=1 Tax='Camptotheca acuminata' phytoplasma TaxID=3239192 RepID=UPI00351A9FE4
MKFNTILMFVIAFILGCFVGAVAYSVFDQLFFNKIPLTGDWAIQLTKFGLGKDDLRTRLINFSYRIYSSIQKIAQPIAKSIEESILNSIIRK